MVSDQIVRVPCVACGRWFDVGARQGWACPACSQPPQPQPESTRGSNPTSDTRRTNAQ